MNPVWLEDAKDRLISTPQWRSLVAQAQALQGGSSEPGNMKGPGALLRTEAYKLFSIEAAKQLNESVTELVPTLPGASGESQTKIDIYSVADGLASLFENVKDPKIGKHYIQKVKAEFIGQSLTPQLRRVLYPLLLSPTYCMNSEFLTNRPPVTHVTAEEEADCSFRIQQILSTEAFQRKVHIKTNVEAAGWAAARAMTIPNLELGQNARDLVLSLTAGLLCGIIGDAANKVLEREEFLSYISAALMLLSSGSITPGKNNEVKFDKPEKGSIATEKISLQMGRAFSFLDPELLRALTAIGQGVFARNNQQLACPAAEFIIRPFTSSWFFGAMSLDAALYCLDQCLLAGFFVAAPCLLCGVLTAPGVRGQIMYATTKGVDVALRTASESIQKLANRGDLSVEMLKKASFAFLDPLRKAAEQGLNQSFTDAFDTAAAAGVAAMKDLPIPEYKICAKWRSVAKSVVIWLKYFKCLKENIEKRRNLFLMNDPEAVVLKAMRTVGIDGQKIILEMPPIIPSQDTVGTAVARIMALENAQAVFGDDEELEVEFAEALSGKLSDKIPSLFDDSGTAGLRTTVDVDGKTRPLYFRPLPKNRDLTTEIVRTLFHAHMRSMCINNDVVAALCRDLFVFSETVRRGVDAGDVDIPDRMQFGLPIRKDVPFCEHFKKGEVCVYGSKCGFTHGTELPKPMPVKPKVNDNDRDDEELVVKKSQPSVLPMASGPPAGLQQQQQPGGQQLQRPPGQPSVGQGPPGAPVVRQGSTSLSQSPDEQPVPIRHGSASFPQGQPLGPPVRQGSVSLPQAPGGLPPQVPPSGQPPPPPGAPLRRDSNASFPQGPPPGTVPPARQSSDGSLPQTQPPPGPPARQDSSGSLGRPVPSPGPAASPPPPPGSADVARRASIASSRSGGATPPLSRQNTASSLGVNMTVPMQLLLKISTIASSVVHSLVCGDMQELQENRVRSELRAVERAHLLQQAYEEVLKKKLTSGEFSELRASHHEPGNKVAKTVEKKLEKMAKKVTRVRK